MHTIKGGRYRVVKVADDVGYAIVTVYVEAVEPEA